MHVDETAVELSRETGLGPLSSRAESSAHHVMHTADTKTSSVILRNNPHR